MRTPDTVHAPEPARPASSNRPWTFLTNHGHVLLTVALDPDVRVREVARVVGITTRHALLILRDLEDAGYVHRERVGRATHYTVHSNRPFRHPTAAGHRIAELIAIFTDSRDSSPTARTPLDATPEVARDA